VRVVIDARMVGPVPHGFARYVTRIADGLNWIREYSELRYEPVFLVKPGQSEFNGFQAVPLEAPFLSFSEIWEIPRALKSLRADLYHSPTFSSLLFSPCPWIVTIHDLNHLTFGGFKERAYYNVLLKPFARRAQMLLSVSDFSRGEIAAWLKCPRERIGIVPNALAPELGEPFSADQVARVLSSYGLKKGSYFFCLSNPKPHKNVPLLLEAFSKMRAGLAQDQSPWPLVLSMKSFPEREGVIQLGGIKDIETQALLRGAGAIVFPSLYEGFGLPPVEAAAVGIPVIVSKIPPHREALSVLKDDEIFWVESRDVTAWADTLARAVAGELRAPSRQGQLALLSQYSVSSIGQNMDRIYRRVLGIA